VNAVCWPNVVGLLFDALNPLTGASVMVTGDVALTGP
jgi:hypothetical protein